MIDATPTSETDHGAADRATAPPTSQGDGVYQQLLKDLRTGLLPPGARLMETEIAGRLGVSRTPVREAIRRLESGGLVVHQPRIGATVRSLDYSEVMELYEMRLVLEGTGARLAARSATEIEFDELGAINAEMAAAEGDGATLFALNQQFHRVLIDAARNRFLVRAVNAVHTTLLILGPSTLGRTDRAHAAVDEHRAIVDALRTRDGEAAEAAMRSHMVAAQRTRLKMLREAIPPADAPTEDIL